ncbi:hypothetical protein DFR58_13425 [Anaerobacterium chartisolvens]|uniref:Uncharacterized protein n=1 Tax=Anaerobacterium chartisolvens TaxID=1297424 RepID=A0A369AKC3_9FIRM|nr:hypothetical protein [Anaerobacterium chartisolvens]RCX09621.1 hypothetical protein DFR58_13425 [Anaerobacterium chartisolvens]
MEIKREKLRELMNTYCDDNYNRFARELDINPSQLYRVMNTGVGGGKKVVGAVMKFCRMRGLDFNTYIDI